MATPLNVLIAEDSQHDAELAAAQLHRHGYDPKWKRVETEAKYLAELKKLPDIILSDYSMPRFSGLRAAQLLKESGLDIPFILISGTVGEEMAVEAMKHGATDYLMKDRISRLGQAVARALEQRQLRKQEKLAEEALLRSRAEFKELFDNAPVGFHEVDAKGRLVRINNTELKMLGYSAGELLGQFVWKISAEEETSHRATLAKLGGESPPPQGFERKFRRKDGSIFPVLINDRILKREDGVITGIRSTIQDISERMRAETELQESQALYYSLVEQLPAGVFRKDVEGRYVFVNDWFCRLKGVKAELFLGKKPREVARLELAAGSADPAEVKRLASQGTDHHEQIIQTGGQIETEERGVGPDGKEQHLYVVKSPVYGSEGTVVGTQGILFDITGRKRAEAALRENEAFLNTVIESIPHMIFVKDAKELRFMKFNKAGEELLGYSLAEMAGKNDYDFFPKELADHFTENDRRVLRGKEVVDIPEEPVQTRNKGARILHTKKIPVFDGAGRPLYLLGISEDITEHRRATDELLWKTAFLEAQVESAPDAILVVNRQGKKILQNQRLFHLFKIPDWIIQSDDDAKLLEHVTQQMKDPVGFKERVAHLYAHPDEVGHDEIEMADGTMLDRYSSPVQDKAGNYYGRIWTFRDITERRELEKQFRQAQKMESIGQLAGGVAHDFNNILAIIQMQSDLLRTSDGLSPEQLDFAEGIAKASQRGAALTRQLLLFSRKEVMQARNLDLNQSINDMAKMLRRLLGENVQMQFIFSAQPLNIHADASMLDQTLLNLAVNARDAMPRGGRLSIETSAVEFDEFNALQIAHARPGSFACLSVSDVGCGIPSEHLPKIFEPFFTTKEVGKGTGLGLATVFGIVQQHKGWINVHSKVGHGTTFRIYLPRLATTPGQNAGTTMAVPRRGGSETILLVEDETSLRAPLSHTLSQLGYRVLGAENGAEALKIWRQHRDEIRLLLTDLVMPGGITGRDLAEQLLKENPGLKVVYTSGHSAEVAGGDFPLREGVNFLTKPFATDTLVQTIRNCLDKI